MASAIFAAVSRRGIVALDILSSTGRDTPAALAAAYLLMPAFSAARIAALNSSTMDLLRAMLAPYRRPAPAVKILDIPDTARIL